VESRAVEKPTIPPEIIDCIAQGRTPGARELHQVARHIWSDITGRPFDACRAAGSDPAPWLHSLRVANAALAGCD